MARINVEQKALTDARYAVLAKLLGLADADHALGRMIHIWNECQERETYVLQEEVICAIMHHESAASYLVISELAQNKGHGSYRIRGTKGRIEWLAKCRNKGRLGGKKGGRPKKPLGVILDETPGGYSWKTPPAPAPTPAPKESEPELCAVATAPHARTATRSNGLPDGFPEWWATYRDGLSPRPMRDKAKCADLWRAEKFTTAQAAALLARLQEQIDFRKQARADKQFVPELPDPIRYLKRRLWHEELPDA